MIIDVFKYESINMSS